MAALLRQTLLVAEACGGSFSLLGGVMVDCHCQLDAPSIICKETLIEGLSRSDRPVQVSLGDCLDGLMTVVLNL